MIRTVVFKVEKDIIDENARLAEEMRRYYDEHGVKVLEFLGGPGSGKTTVIERLVEKLLANGYKPDEIGYIGGDIATTLDTERIARYGVKHVQVNTGGTCHLNVTHILEAIKALGGLEGLKVLFIENVGNLVCPFSFPLGAHARILVLDAAAGDDKPLKHPMSILKSNVIVVNKIDIAPYVGIDVEKIVRDAKRINPRAEVVPVSAKTGEGMDKLYQVVVRIIGEG